MEVEILLVEGGGECIVRVQGDGEIQEVYFGGERLDYPFEAWCNLHCLFELLEVLGINSRVWVTEPQTKGVINEPSVKWEVVSILNDHVIFTIDGIVDVSQGTGRWSAHCSASKLFEKHVPNSQHEPEPKRLHSSKNALETELIQPTTSERE